MGTLSKVFAGELLFISGIGTVVATLVPTISLTLLICILTLLLMAMTVGVGFIWMAFRYGDRIHQSIDKLSDNVGQIASRGIEINNITKHTGMENNTQQGDLAIELEEVNVTSND